MKKPKPPPPWLHKDMLVHYHPVIGEPHNGKVYRTRTEPELLSGHTWVVWLTEVSGCVCCEAVSQVDPEKPLTVGELIACLQTYPQGMRVMVQGYETGLTDVKIARCSVEKVYLDISPPERTYSGEHRTFRPDDEIDDDCEGKPTVDALVLWR